MSLLRQLYSLCSNPIINPWLSFSYGIKRKGMSLCLKIQRRITQVRIKLWNNNFIMISLGGQYVSNKIMQEIVKDTNKMIDFYQKVDNNKNQYSSGKALSIITQLNQHSFVQPKDSNTITEPKDLKNIKQDCLMSVYKVKQKMPLRRRGRSKTKFGRDFISKLSFPLSTISQGGKRKMSNYDNACPLKQYTSRKNNSSESSNSSDTSQQKDIAEMRSKKLEEEQKTQLLGSSRNNIQGVRMRSLDLGERKNNERTFTKLKQKINKKKPFVQDYNGEEMKLKNVPKERLVTQQKSLLYEIPKKIEKLKTEKKKNKVQAVEVPFKIVVTERKKKKKEEKRRRRRTLVQEEIPLIEPINVQFSTISSLAQNFRCQPGVALSQGSETIRNRSSLSYSRVPESLLAMNNRRLSKRQFSLVKKRSEQNLQSSTDKYSQNQDSEDNFILKTPKKHSSSMKTEPYKNLTNRSKPEKIYINEEFLYSDLIKPHRQKKMTEETRYKTLQPQSDLQPKLSANDKFNQRYMKGKLQISTKKLDSLKQKQIVTGGFMLLPKLRDPYFKNRQKLQRKSQIYQALGKRFEETLRKEQQIPG